MATINDVLFYSFQNDLSDHVNTFEEPVNFSWTRGSYNEGYEGTDYGLIPQFESLSDQAFRQHGTVMYARVIPELRYNSFNTKIEKLTGNDSVTKSSYLHVAPGIELGYEKHRAIDLKWQRNFRAGVRFVYTNYLVSKPNENSNYPFSRVYANYEIGYYPNSRSVIEGIGGLAISHFGGSESKSTFITPEVGLNAGYFISYNTVVRASFYANYAVQTGTVNESNFNQGLRVYLRHYFF
jgi:hypothetical protein